jgi:hypothetical protein
MVHAGEYREPLSLAMGPMLVGSRTQTARAALTQHTCNPVTHQFPRYPSSQLVPCLPAGRDECVANPWRALASSSVIDNWGV